MSNLEMNLDDNSDKTNHAIVKILTNSSTHFGEDEALLCPDSYCNVASSIVSAITTRFSLSTRASMALSYFSCTYIAKSDLISLSRSQIKISDKGGDNQDPRLIWFRKWQNEWYISTPKVVTHDIIILMPQSKHRLYSLILLYHKIQRTYSVIEPEVHAVVLLQNVELPQLPSVLAQPSPVPKKYTKKPA